MNSGLLSLCDILYDYLDIGLILGFVERWHSKSNNFHLPIGELTIFLDDMWLLLYLPIMGKVFTKEPLDYEDAIKTLMILLIVDRPMTMDKL